MRWRRSPRAADAGELQTATSAAGADYVPATALEARIAEVIRGVTSKREQKPKFVKIQLQFPKVAAVFEKVRATFAEIDEDKSGTIELSEIKTALAKVSVLFALISGYCHRSACAPAATPSQIRFGGALP